MAARMDDCVNLRVNRTPAREAERTLNLGRASLFSPILRVDELLGANGSGAASLDSFCQENTCAKSQHQVAQAPQLRMSRRGTSQQEQ